MLIGRSAQINETRSCLFTRIRCAIYYLVIHQTCSDTSNILEMYVLGEENLDVRVILNEGERSQFFQTTVQSSLCLSALNGMNA